MEAIVMANRSTLRQMVHDLLDKQLAAGFYYHNWQHTLNVTNRALFYANEEGVSPEDVLLVETAALLHDTGYTQSYEGHEQASVQITQKILPRFDYTQTQIDTVTQLILATDPSQPPRTPLEAILCDADLDSLGRDDFCEQADKLRQELHAVRGFKYSDAQWRQRLVDFLIAHTYHTPSARRHREAGKARNLAGLGA